MKGVKLYNNPEDIKRTVILMKELKIDTVLLGNEASGNKALISALQIAKISPFLVFPVFYNPEYLKENINHGCFCDNCLNDFSQMTALPTDMSGQSLRNWILEKAPLLWSEWKQQKIFSAAKDLIAAIHSVNPKLKTAIHIVPWMSGEFGNGREEIAGQSIQKLSALTDFLTPMTYGPMCQRGSEWTNILVRDMDLLSSVPIVPAIQVAKAYDEEVVSPERFRADLTSALQNPSGGVLLWSWETLMMSPEKQNIFKEI